MFSLYNYDNASLGEKISYWDGVWMLYRIIKRAFDFIVALIASVITIPVFLLIAIAIKVDSRGPVFFVHHRVGKEGKPLSLLKFRTMVVGAEEMIKNFNPEQEKEWQDNFKLENDPRITRIGKFLRKTSLDELPQLYNILIGNLSFVGPRPVTKEEIEKYGENKVKVLSVSPGLTGWWACNGRSNIDYEERMKLELYYVDHASLSLDIKILFKTVGVIATHEGAR